MRETIRPRDSLPVLEAIALAEKVDLEAIEVVPSIQAWCEIHGIDESHSSRMGKTVRNLSTLKARILLAEEITPQMQSNVCVVLDSRGFGDRTEELEDSARFLLHLFLHELGHARDDSASEQDCDTWAFLRLATYAA